MFIAELEHPEFDRFDLTQPAHRHHGRRAMPGGGDAAGDRADAHAEVLICYGQTETSARSTT
jgi:hypothetical protein